MSTCFASIAGFRIEMLVTSEPSLMRCVSTASAASVVHASRIGMSGTRGIAKRSATQPTSKPSDSAKRKSSRSSGYGTSWPMKAPNRIGMQADDGGRTRDLRLGKPALCQLSYVRAVEPKIASRTPNRAASRAYTPAL